MGKNAGFDLLLPDGVKIGSFTTTRQGTKRNMYLNGPNGSHFHAGAFVIDDVMGKTFGVPSHMSGEEKIHGPTEARAQRSTSPAIGQLMIEKTTGEMVKVSFCQGEYQTEQVQTTGFEQKRDERYLPLPQDFQKATLGIHIYDAQSEIALTTDQTILEWSSDSTGVGILLTLDDWTP